MLTEEYSSKSIASSWEAYWQIDGTDQIVCANDNFIHFAQQASIPHLSPVPVGQSVWDFIPNLEIRHLLRVLLARVRLAGKTIDLPYRPGGAGRCLLLLRMQPADSHGGVTFRCRPLGKQAQPIFPPGQRRFHDDPVRICSWCNRVLTDAGWNDPEEADTVIDLFRRADKPELTHGICDDCLAGILTSPPAAVAG